VRTQAGHEPRHEPELYVLGDSEDGAGA